MFITFIKNITFTNKENTFYANKLISQKDFDHEIEIESAEPITNLKRGWLGNFVIEYSLKDNLGKDQGSYLADYNDMLLAKCKMDTAADKAGVITYIFEKD